MRTTDASPTRAGRSTATCATSITRPALRSRCDAGCGRSWAASTNCSCLLCRGRGPRLPRARPKPAHGGATAVAGAAFRGVGSGTDLGSGRRPTRSRTCASSTRVGGTSSPGIAAMRTARNWRRARRESRVLFVDHCTPPNGDAGSLVAMEVMRAFMAHGCRSPSSPGQFAHMGAATRGFAAARRGRSTIPRIRACRSSWNCETTRSTFCSCTASESAMRTCRR